MEDNKNLHWKIPIIVDLGSGEVKAGFNGTETIQSEFPN
jgi:actin-related protein